MHNNLTIMKLFKFLIVFLAFSSACNPDKIDTRGVKKELESQKLKKISEGEILTEAGNMGNLIVDSLQKTISRKLDSALSKGGIEAAIPFCILSNYALKDSLEQKHEVLISRSSFPEKLRNQKSIPDNFQKEILDAYSYSQEKGLPVFKDVQIREKEIIFNAPVILSEKLCLRCHGVPGKDLTEAEYQLIHSLYPQDKSVNMKMNEVMGLWTVKFNKEELIKNIK